MLKVTQQEVEGSRFEPYCLASDPAYASSSQLSAHQARLAPPSWPPWDTLSGALLSDHP